MKRALAVLIAAGISVAYAGSAYHVTLYKPTTVNGKQFTPGECKVELQGDKVVIKQGKTTVESNVTVQNAAQKFDLTTVGYENGSDQLHDLRLAGTTLKLLFDSGAKTASAGGSR